MYKFHIKSIVLGIGIGIVITSFIGIIYSAGMSVQISKDEIMEKAEQYGMVQGKSLVENQKKDEIVENKQISEDKQISQDKQINEDNQINEEEGKKQDQTNPVTIDKKEEVLINIKYGDTSETVAKKLFTMGLIQSEKNFVDNMKKLKLQGSIQVGEFKIIPGMDDTSIARIICELAIN